MSNIQSEDLLSEEQPRDNNPNRYVDFLSKAYPKEEQPSQYHENSKVTLNNIDNISTHVAKELHQISTIDGRKLNRNNYGAIIDDYALNAITTTKIYAKTIINSGEIYTYGRFMANARRLFENYLRNEAP